MNRSTADRWEDQMYRCATCGTSTFGHLCPDCSPGRHWSDGFAFRAEDDTDRWGDQR